MAKYDIRAPFNRAHPEKKKKNATLDKGMDYFDWKNVVDMWYKEVDIFDEHNVSKKEIYPLSSALCPGETVSIFHANWPLFPAGLGGHRQGKRIQICKENQVKQNFIF